MLRSLATAATGMQAQQLHVEIISNNIANLNSLAYKRQRVQFQDLLYQNIVRAGVNSSDAGDVVPTGIQIGIGVGPGSVYRINEQGELLQTGNKTDVAIRGKGYFQIQLPNGDFAYTRDGAFQLNAEGEIVTSKGYTVSPGLAIPQEAIDVNINDSGEVIIILAGNTPPQTLGQLEIYDFQNKAGLEAVGDNTFMQTVASGAPVSGVPGVDGLGTIFQGWLENSNVNPVEEVTTLILAQRGYELNSKVIQAADEMMQQANQLRR